MPLSTILLKISNIWTLTFKENNGNKNKNVWIKKAENRKTDFITNNNATLNIPLKIQNIRALKYKENQRKEEHSLTIVWISLKESRKTINIIFNYSNSPMTTALAPTISTPDLLISSRQPEKWKKIILQIENVFQFQLNF